MTKKKTTTKTNKTTPKIETLLNKGISTSNIQNALTINQNSLNQAKKRLITPLLNNTQYLTLIIKQENLTKINHRLTYTATYKDQNNNKLLTTQFYNKTPEQVITILKQSIEQTKEINPDAYTQPITTTLKQQKAKNTKTHKKGTTNKIQLTIHLLKNK